MAASMADMFWRCAEPEAARRSVEIRHIGGGKGKGLFATRSIRKGETIFKERPLTAEENARRLSGNVHVSLPYPELCTIQNGLHQQCPDCQVSYCSAECLKAARDQYHQVLCLGSARDNPAHPLNKMEEAWRNMHYPPETASIMLMARMVATVKQAKDKDWWLQLFTQFCSKTANEEEEIVHKLLGDKFKGQLDQLRRLFTEALYEERVSRWFTPEGFRSLFALVGTNGQGIGTSSLSQWVHACDALELPAQKRERLDGLIDQLYKDIEKGWWENYLFICSCAKCLSQSEDPDFTSEEEDEDAELEETDDAELEDEMTDV
uniref:SET and MYND domain-containing protein 5 n=1 Tax=Pyxicephalus adspersus TaxID=30357 RepID=A0AAV3AJX9_PYXAD|nr:TPA: hypothetical protein GDO54_009754 [Pyxicephalus adspersus]